MMDAGHISIRALLIFIDVYETQNFSVVARREGISASQVSRVIHQLEDALGQQLFYRNTRAIMPTESGHLLCAMPGRWPGIWRTRDASWMNAPASRRARCVSMARSFSDRGTSRRACRGFWRVTLVSIELTLTDDFIDPHRDAADVIFRIGALTDSSFHARVFGQQFYHLAASPDYLRKHGAPEGPDDLSRHHCLVYRGSSGPNRWLIRQPGKAWVHYPIVPLMTSNNAETLLIAALGGMGVVLFPDWMVSERLKSGELVALLPEMECSINTEPLTIAAIYPNARHPPLNVRAVIDYYIERFGTPLYWQT